MLPVPLPPAAMPSLPPPVRYCLYDGLHFQERSYYSLNHFVCLSDRPSVCPRHTLWLEPESGKKETCLLLTIIFIQNYFYPFIYLSSLSIHQFSYIPLYLSIYTNPLCVWVGCLPPPLSTRRLLQYLRVCQVKTSVLPVRSPFCPYMEGDYHIKS